MPADSALRKLLKALLRPVLNERTYQIIQGAAKAWDISRGSWSEPEVDLLPLAVRPGETAIDIGANFGLYCYHLSHLVGRTGRVYAFEPIPFTYRTCRLVGRLLRFHGNVELIPKGCSDRTATVTFTVPLQRSGAISAGQSHLAGRNDERPQKEAFAAFERTVDLSCEVVALDEALPNLRDLSLIKSDIEGADLLALRGATRLIEQHHPTILCEIEPWFLEGFGIAPQALSEFFSTRDYSLYHYERLNGHRYLRPASFDRLGSYGSHNYVLIHPSRRERFAAFLTPANDVATSVVPQSGCAEVQPNFPS